jgi:hypothetical protein
LHNFSQQIKLFGEEVKMKRCLLFYILAAIFFWGITTVAIAGQGKGCSLQGAWAAISDGSVVIATYTGQSNNYGTINEEIPATDPTFGGIFPYVTKSSNLKGMWERTGGNTFVYTQIAVAVDAVGNVQYVAKNSGKKTLSDGCNMQTVESSIEFFVPPNINPFEDEAWLTLPLDPIYAYRMRIDPSPLLGD